ncbi:MAG: glycosyltransferase [Candidatus Cyclobacteriaceae bacterium M2_1C_046]
MKVCFFNTNKDWGGGEKWHFEMAARLHQDGYKILTVTAENSPLQEKMIASQLPNKSFKIGNLSFLNFYKINKLKHFFEKEQVDIIIMNLSSDVKTAAVAAKWAGVKRIIYRRGSAIPISASIVNKLVFHNCITHVLANSEETKRTVNANTPLISPDKIKVIYNGLKVTEKEKPPVNPAVSDQLILGHAGRLAPQKNQVALIELAEKLKNEGVDFHLVIAGDGKLKEDLLKLTASKGLDDKITFIGFQKDVPSFMKTIDIFILTSLWEGFGYVLAEAMFAGKPVVAFNNSSNPEIVADNETGFLVPTNDIDALKDKILLLQNNPELRREMGQKGQERVLELFTFERAVQELKEFLTEA